MSFVQDDTMEHDVENGRLGLSLAALLELSSRVLFFLEPIEVGDDGMVRSDENIHTTGCNFVQDGMTRGTVVDANFQDRVGDPIVDKLENLKLPVGNDRDGADDECASRHLLTSQAPTPKWIRVTLWRIR